MIPCIVRRLYLTNHSTLLPDVRVHLNTGADGTCAGQTGLCVNVRDTSHFLDSTKKLLVLHDDMLFSTKTNILSRVY